MLIGVGLVGAVVVTEVVVLVGVLLVVVVVFGILLVEALVSIRPVLPPRLMVTWSTSGSPPRPMAA